MSSHRYDDPREETSSVPPGGSGAAGRSRPRPRFQSIIALVFSCGVLWWTIQAVLTDNPTAKDAIRAMGSWNASERVGAIQELEISGLGHGKIAIPPLVVALGDKDARVRTAAAAALGPIGSDTASSGKEREAVGAAIMALLGSLKDSDPSVRAAAANALVTLPVGGKPGVTGPSVFVDPAEVVAILVERMSDRDTLTRLAAIQIMAALGPEAAGDPPNELVAALRDEAASVRAVAIVTLGSFPRNLDASIPSVLRMMGHDEPMVRSACASVLTRLSVPTNYTAALVPELIASLGHPDRRVRAVAGYMLQKLGPSARAAIPALIATAREPRVAAATGTDLSSWFPDLVAIEALGQIAPRTESGGQVVAILTEIVRADAPDQWRAAVAALEAFGPDAASAVPELIRTLPKSIVKDPKYPDPSRVTSALSRIAPGTKSAGEAVAALVPLLRAGDSEVRHAAADALGAFGPGAASAVPDLIGMLKGSNEAESSNVADSVIKALGRIAPGTPTSGRAVSALIDALDFRSPLSKRSEAARVLASFGAEAADAIPHLRAGEQAGREGPLERAGDSGRELGPLERASDAGSPAQGRGGPEVMRGPDDPTRRKRVTRLRICSSMPVAHYPDASRRPIREGRVASIERSTRMRRLT